VDVDVDEVARTVVLHRGGLRVVCNLGAASVTLALGTPIGRILLASEPVAGEDDALVLPPESFAVAQVAPVS
jgi:maltooligosyltrehalose trehalohydrolase